MANDTMRRAATAGPGGPAARPPPWTPSREHVRATNLAGFATWVAEHGEGPGPADGYHPLWRWSITEQSAFWAALWEWCGVVGERGGRVLVDGDRMPGARYFPDARINFAENLLRRRTDDPAIIARSEDGARRVVTWRELYDLVSRLARAMRDQGIGPGDRVAALLPNVPEAVVILLASASIGAVLSTASPDFGVGGVVDRFGQVGPRLLFVVDGYSYRGKRYDPLERLPSILEGLPTVERTVVVANAAEASAPDPGPAAQPGDPAAAGTRQEPTSAAAPTRPAPAAAAGPDIARITAPILFNDFIAPYPPAEIPFARLPFDHPLYILFSSGTTGVPKCIVHRAGGVLLQHLKEHRLHCDIRPGDRVLYYTTLGWMMWNWLVSALASEATILLYDGSPVHPGNGALFDFAEAAGMTLLGTSPGYLYALRKSGFRPRESYDLRSLRTVISTGSPLSAEGFEYVYEHVKPDVHLASVSGGTDLCACFVGGVPIRPVRAGEIQGPALGMATDVFADDGTPLDAGKGELVCTRPFPSLPLGFVGDDDGSRYGATYFDRFPGVWHHGDYAEKTASGGYVIHGRSDATLNAHGVRIGTAEVYRPVEAMDEVAEALAIAQRWEEGERMVLFVRLAPEVRLDEELEGRIRDVLRTQASPRHVPARVVQVPDIPRTRSGKIVELAVRAVVHGEPVRNRGALANPEALEWFRGVGEGE